jgi:hypothetical protein
LWLWRSRSGRVGAGGFIEIIEEAPALVIDMGKWRVVFSLPIMLEAADLGTMTSARGHDLCFGFSFSYYALARSFSSALTST